MAQEEKDRERSSETFSRMFRDDFPCPTDKQLENATITHSHKADDIMLFRNCLCFHACESNAKPTIPPEIFPGVTNRSVPVSY